MQNNSCSIHLTYQSRKATATRNRSGPSSYRSSRRRRQRKRLLLKVAEHSFQVPMPNSPFLLNHLCFGARFLQESRLTTEVFILAFWQGCVLLPWQRG